MNLLTIDLETTLNADENVGLGHPRSIKNDYVVGGFNCSETSDNVVVFSPKAPGGWDGAKHFDFLVGQNIPFDLQYLYRNPKGKEQLQKYRLWDTQLAEYILTGQQAKWASLDELAKKYGFPLKDDKIKEYFKAGIGSDRIPEEELLPYLAQDILVTRDIAKKQIEEAINQGQLDLMISQMEALHATTEMMYNGMRVDEDYLAEYTVDVTNAYAEVETELRKAINAFSAGNYVADLTSAQQISRFFFGGKHKYKEKVLVGVYKNGKDKWKVEEKLAEIKGVYPHPPEDKWVSSKTGVVSVDDSVIKTILAKMGSGSSVGYVCELLLKFRDLQKQLSTYVTGLSKQVQHDEEGNAYIYGSLNHTATVTGRLSSTKPNMQNISNNPIKKMFISRFGPNGSLVEVDFSQLEVIGLAHVTMDKQLIHDIKTGTDMHSELYKEMYGKYPTKEERKPFKARTFALLYGAGAKTIAEQASCSVEDAKKFITTFYWRYPGVKSWHEAIAKLADIEGRHLRDADGVVDKGRTFTMKTATGRKFVFKEYYNADSWSGKSYNFSPTELKNYPVQGFATGDVVPMMLGIIFRKLVGRDGIKMINTIHDSLLFDVRDDKLADFIPEISGVLNNTHKYVKATFGFDMALELSAGVSVGKTWYDMKDYVA